MDVSAVMHASDDFLQQLGLEKAGDRLSLKAFCARECATDDKSGESEEPKAKKRTLLESFLCKKSKRPKSAGDLSSKKAVEKSRKIQLGWKHFKDHAQGFVLVPLGRDPNNLYAYNIKPDRFDTRGQSIVLPKR